MILRNSFFNLMKEDLKRRIWTLSLSMLAFFFCLTVTSSMFISNTSNLYSQILELMGPKYFGIMGLTIVGALLCGLSSFFYLNSRKKIDLYHSIPVRREILFGVQFINGILVYLIPYVINLIICILIFWFNNLLDLGLFRVIIQSFLHNMLFFTLLYTITIIAVMLTGNFIVNILGAGVFLSFGSLLNMLYQMYCYTFFKTFYSYRYNNIFMFLSPVEVYSNLANKLTSNELEGIVLSYSKVILVLILTIVIALYLYKMRPSEAASSAMAFHISKPIIKTILVVMASLGGGIIFRNMSIERNGWFIFGLLFFLVLTHSVIEIIYHFDIRKAFINKIQLCICTLIVAFIVVVFQFDLFQYDKYLPKKEQVESMSVYILGLDNNISYFNLYDDSQYKYYVSPGSYHLNNMSLTDYDAAYELSKLAIEEIDNKTYGHYNHYNSYNVKYTLENGREIYRTYILNMEESIEYMRDLYSNLEFKRVHFPIIESNYENDPYITIDNIWESKNLNLSSVDQKKLLDIYRAELMELTLDEIKEVVPVGSITFDYLKLNSTYYIYPSFKNTIAYLNDHGFDIYKELDLDNIVEIKVEYQDYTYPSSIMIEESTMIGRDVVMKQRVGAYTKSYTDKEDMKDIIPNLILSDYYMNNTNLIKVDNSIDVIITIKRNEHDNGTLLFNFKENSVPEFIQRDLLHKE